MSMNLELARACPTSMMAGEDEEETELFKEALKEADLFIKAFSWCKDVKDIYFCYGVGGVVQIFLFNIDRKSSGGDVIDEWLWVVIGDLPSAYLVADDVTNPHDALAAYCEMMRDWIDAVRAGEGMEDVYQVPVPPTEANASQLSLRLDFLMADILPCMN